MIFEVNRDSKVPVFCQIADWIETRIEDGTFGVGECLPAERKMCTQTGAARNTVKRAYEELLKRGCAVTDENGRCLVGSRDRSREKKDAARIAGKAVQKLKDSGISHHETEHLFLQYIWEHLPENEKIRVAWVDCSVEFLRDTAREIENFCNVRVTPLLLDDVMGDGKLLSEADYDVVATTVNHYDDICRRAEMALGAAPCFAMEMVVLGVGRETVTHIAKIDTDMRVVVIYDEEWYRYSIERYLKEFSVKGKIQYVPLGEVMDFLRRNREKVAVILPQDFSYRDEMVGEIYKECMARGIFCFAFQQSIDNGSLMHLKKQVQQRWMEGGNKDRTILGTTL